MPTERVGRAVLELTTDGGSFFAGIEQAKAKARSLGSTISAINRDISRLGAQYSGRSQIAEATKLTSVITAMGGAVRLTKNEQARVNPVLAEAIAKYAALGRTAPAAMMSLEKATRNTGGATDWFTAKMVALGAATGTFAAHLAMQAGRALIEYGKDAFASAGQIVDLHNKTDLSIGTIQRMQFVAEETSTSIETMTQASYKLGIALAGGAPSVKSAVRDLGLDWEKLLKQTSDQQWETVIAALGRVQNTQERNRLGVALFSRTFSEMAASVVEGYDEIARRAKVASDAQIRALDQSADRFYEYWRNLKTGIAGSIGDVLLFQDALNEVKLEDARSGNKRSEGLQLAEAQRRIELGLVGARRQNIELTIQAAAAQQTYVQQLKDLRESFAKLKPAERAELEAGIAIGEQADELERKFHLLPGALTVYKAAIAAETKAETAAAQADKERRKTLTDLEASLKDARANHLAYNQIVEQFGEKADVASGIAATYNLKLGALTTSLARAQQLMSAREMERVKVPDFSLGPTPEQNFDYWDALFKEKDQLETASQERSGARALAAAELAMEQDTRIGASHQRLVADLEHLEQVRSQNAIAAENRRFALESRNIDTTTDLYKTMVDEHNLAVDQIVEAWRQGVEKRAAAELTFSQSVLKNLRDLRDTVPRLLTDAFTGGGGLKGALKAIGVQLAQAFIEPFITTIIKRIAAARLGQALANSFGGGGGGGGTGGALANTAVSAGAKYGLGLLGGGAAAGSVAAEVAGVEAATTAAAGGGAAGAGVGAGIGTAGTIGATAGIGAGVLLAWAIWKKGLFRGGAEHGFNPKRDQFLGQFAQFDSHRDSKNPPGFYGLSELLASTTGGSRLFDPLVRAQKLDAFHKAEAAIVSFFGARHIRKDGSEVPRMKVQSFLMGGFVPPHAVVPAILHGGRFGETITPGDRPPSSRPMHVTFETHISTVDATGLDELFRKQIIPRQKAAMFFNIDGLASATRRAL